MDRVARSQARLGVSLQPHPAGDDLAGLLQKGLEVLGYRATLAGPGLLRVHRAGKAGETERPIAVDPAWEGRVEGLTPALPGSPFARGVWRAVQELGTFAVLAYLPPRHSRPLRRLLWFRFLVVIAGFALDGGVRRRVVDVLADPAREAAVWSGASPFPEGLAGSRAHLSRVAIGGGPAWLSEYEVRRVSGAALRAAVSAAREAVRRVEEELEPAYRAEVRRLRAYFRQRRAEEMDSVRRLARRLASVQAYTRVAGSTELAALLREREGRVARTVGQHEQLLRRRLSQLEDEERQALQELHDRFTLRGRIRPAGLAILWAPEGWPGAAPGQGARRSGVAESEAIAHGRRKVARTTARPGGAG
ncbi:hypothetical protein U7230_06250 [Carboxydochorda subterranea]|uniref:Uncharacterized protein n=1 Tax=Carboxydichorda subterranea TaxID=3109565 RepID=A0ABZ1C0Y6_9FIRM|nr:hypothetical protein [Limnochorda sp. L945t]WRP18599.1 hypothetical protein U7230_06250 [Limnochorda sp. L945t]